MNSARAEVTIRDPARPLRLVVYYLIAFGLSALARLSWRTNDVTDQWPSLGAMHWHLLSGIGPFVGAMVVWVVFRPQRTMSFGGSRPSIAWAMLIVPAATIGVAGVGNPYGFNPHAFGFYLGLWIATYAVLEETGWRGYLQDELRNHPRPIKYTIVGLFWYPWHLTFLQHHTLGNEVAILGLIVSSSFGIGYVADRTHSILAAASFHLIGNILGLTAYFTIFIPSSSTRLNLVGACVVIWLIMLRLWKPAGASSRRVNQR